MIVSLVSLLFVSPLLPTDKKKQCSFKPTNTTCHHRNNDNKTKHKLTQ